MKRSSDELRKFQEQVSIRRALREAGKIRIRTVPRGGEAQAEEAAKTDVARPRKQAASGG